MEFGSDRRQPTRPVNKRQIREGLERAGMRRGDVVLVHSSLSRFGFVEGGADTVIDALQEVLGREGTLMMSAITTSPAFTVPCIEAAKKGLLADVKPFGPAVDPSWAGRIAETFRRRPTVLRSLHPTHSVSAWGARADEMIADHQNAPGPCGDGTPYARLTELERGFILLLGVNHQSNTALHGMEEIAGCEYALCPEVSRIPIITPNGASEAVTRVHLPYMRRCLGILEGEYIDGVAETVTHIGGSYVRFVNGMRMREITLSALTSDPFLFLTEDAKEAYEWMKRTGNWTVNPREQNLTPHGPSDRS